MKTGTFYIKRTTEDGAEPLFDCRNLSYDEAVGKLNLLEQGFINSGCDNERKGEDVLFEHSTCIEDFVLYEIAEED